MVARGEFLIHEITLRVTKIYSSCPITTTKEKLTCVSLNRGWLSRQILPCRDEKSEDETRRQFTLKLHYGSMMPIKNRVYNII